jgi:hypothetical protein
MLGGLDDTGLEGLMRRALEAAALDVLESALETGSFGDVVLVADRAPVEPLPNGVRITLDDTAEPFHFGERLTEAVDDSGCGRFVYVGAGAAPLLGAADLASLAARMDADGPLCVTNNFYSADLFALRPAGLVRRIEPWPPADNGVPRALKEQLDVVIDELPRTTATQLNLDSPIDLVAIGLANAGGPRLRALVKQWDPDSARLAAAARVLTDRHGEVLIAGRVSSRAWRYLESETACRVRLLSEERGMTAAGRDTDLSARSMLGQLIDVVGVERCFHELIPQLCDAAFIDIRPVIAHLGWQPSRADRFAADLGLADQIEDLGLRGLVVAAAAAPVPVILGGHSLVVGALMLLNDWVWSEHDRLLTE